MADVNVLAVNLEDGIPAEAGAMCEVAGCG